MQKRDPRYFNWPLVAMNGILDTYMVLNENNRALDTFTNL